jgi:putative SOS response-associated peptidase YedK
MTQQTSPSEVARIFDAVVQDREPFQPNWNVAPTDPVTTVLQRDVGRAVERMRWGLIPAWAHSSAAGARMINARAETILRSPAFRVAVRRRRCLVPADGFYEWARLGRTRLPYHLRAAAGTLSPLPLAGVWSLWKDPATGSWVPSCAVVTTGASAQVAPLHDRMPVILGPDDWPTWLHPDLADTDELLALLLPAADSRLEIFRVAPLVNSVRNNGPDLVAPVSAGMAVQDTEALPAQARLFD